MFKVIRALVVRHGVDDHIHTYEVARYENIREAIDILGEGEIVHILNQAQETERRMQERHSFVSILRNPNTTRVTLR